MCGCLWVQGAGAGCEEVGEDGYFIDYASTPDHRDSHPYPQAHPTPLPSFTGILLLLSLCMSTVTPSINQKRCVRIP